MAAGGLGAPKENVGALLVAVLVAVAPPPPNKPPEDVVELPAAGCPNKLVGAAVDGVVVDIEASKGVLGQSRGSSNELES